MEDKAAGATASGEAEASKPTPDSAKVVLEATPSKLEEKGKKPSTNADPTKKKAAKKSSSKKQKKPEVIGLAGASLSDGVSDSDSGSSSSSSSSDSDSGSGSDSSDSDSSGDEKEKRHSKKSGKGKGKKKMIKKKSKKPIRIKESSGSGSDSDSDSDSSDSSSSSSSDSSSSSSFDGNRNHKKHRHVHHNNRENQLLQLQHQQQQQQQQLQPLHPLPPMPRMDISQQFALPLYVPYPYNAAGMGHPAPQVPHYDPPPRLPPPQHLPPPAIGRGRARRMPPTGRLIAGRIPPNNLNIVDVKHRAHRSKGKRSKSSRLEFKRVDQVWDSSIHNYKLQDTAEGSPDSAYEGYLFHVRRTFDWEGKYKQTIVDIKSKILREALQEVMGDIKGVSLVEETPKLDPNMLFLYLEDMRNHLKVLKKAKPTGDKKSRKKQLKRNVKKRKELKILVKYLDKDYEAVKNSLNPMLKNGIITFDLLWALWKPNTLAYTTTYGSPGEPRIFKAEMCEKHFSIMKGDYYYIEGKYFEYDGKRFGYGGVADEIDVFRGTRSITSLPIYPLQYHKDEERLRKDLIERGKKFVALSGVQYKTYDGMAYYKKKKVQSVRVNISGRIMIDSSLHRRINPNYPVSIVRPKEHGIHGDGEDSDSSGRGGHYGSDSDTDAGSGQPSYVTKTGSGDAKRGLDKIQGKDEESNAPADTAEDSSETTPADGSTEGDAKASAPLPQFNDEEYLLASPLVLGFAFAEKLWLEFSVSAINDIQWNENAYESLVLEPKTKDIVKALVESHKYHAAESIDDVIQGKGKGLVAVLHGPPGTGKTLTAEGISELLKCPLYMVSAGELGTDSRFLESELQKILDICHAWGAILLLDEADVFLEKRNMHDIHRNALVSIFLRQLEYFQGILFLTTNRVETFDDAFQSRIHIALRYNNLDHRAKKLIFKIFIERVRMMEKIDLMPFSEEDYNTLARHDLNGRQIKNTVRTAQALAVNKHEPLCMDHIRQVLDVQMSFDRDLKGGPGFQDAMRSYF